MEEKMICPECKSWSILPGDNFCSWCGAPVSVEIKQKPEKEFTSQDEF